MNATTLAYILHGGSAVPFVVGLLYYEMGLMGWGFLILIIMNIAGIVVYRKFNPERDKENEEKERRRKEFKEQLRRANRFSCPNCGTVVEGNDCPSCKAHYPDIRPSKFPENDYSYNKKSYAGMYALSILLGFIGGIIAWASLRNENPSVGVNCLILGIIVTIVSMGIGAVFLF